MNRKTVVQGVENKEDELYEAVLKTERSDEKAFVKKINDSKLWHARLSHASETTIQKNIPLVRGMDVGSFKVGGVCKICMISKSKRRTRLPRSHNSKHGTILLDFVHCDLQGPIHSQRLCGAK